MRTETGPGGRERDGADSEALPLADAEWTAFQKDTMEDGMPLEVRLENVELAPDGVPNGWKALLVVEDVAVCTMEATGSSRPRICHWSNGGDPQDLLAVFVAVRRGDWPGIGTVGALCASMLPNRAAA